MVKRRAISRSMIARVCAARTNAGCLRDQIARFRIGPDEPHHSRTIGLTHQAVDDLQDRSSYPRFRLSR